MRSACLCQPDVGLLLTSDSSYSLRLHRAVEMFEGDWLMMFGSRTTLGSAARAPSPNADTVRWELLGMGCSDSIVRCCCFCAYRAVSVPSQAYRAVRRRLTLFFIARSQKGGLDFLCTNGSDDAPTISVSVFAGPQREPFA